MGPRDPFQPLLYPCIPSTCSPYYNHIKIYTIFY